MVVACPTCKRRIMLPETGRSVQNWECPLCHVRFHFSEGRLVSCGSWTVSEDSGELRAVCPHCRQHYEADAPEDPVVVDCVYCGEPFCIPILRRPASEESGSAPYGSWVVSESSGKLRAVCPFCHQHYAAPEPEVPRPINCVYCGEKFVLAPRWSPEEPGDADDTVVPECDWVVSENSGELRAVCPHCRQHYAASKPEKPLAVNCVYCGEKFRLMPGGGPTPSAEKASPLPKCGWTAAAKGKDARATCPFCHQHYATPEPESPRPVDCVYCGEKFLLVPRFRLQEAFGSIATLPTAENRAHGFRQILAAGCRKIFGKRR